MTLTLTADEVDLLRDAHRIIAPIVATSSMTDHVRSTMCGGGNGRFCYEVRGNKLTGWWPSQWKPEREASITLTRVRKWADSLPDDLRARALVAWRVHPVNTRDIPALYRITLEAIDLEGRRELEQTRDEWFTEPPSSAATPTSPHCTANDHAGCWAGRERPPNNVCWRDRKNRRVSPRGIVATFRPGWSPHTHTTNARIVSPVEHHTCECDCHSLGYAGQQLDLFQAVTA
ncbi:hypothetical protein KNU39_gp57 [Gordonia phage Mutzi]|uniref:Uncharacterized protein n=2 Tax=Wizardvirus TaxID=2169658 RepID=A0A5P8DA60_9CAUD|nr:hypothetical protein KNU39_gp57 [Gordonia phage Mutzi]YP_010104274.1 hypothetical protein KNU74_gp60 [Gordonia phage Fireball]QAX92868.1 hypothetical protein SEA_MUTZI_57 [Gordonia phage Mutzi]QFP95885.1 hypothetical protein SEA_FIREBALL_60 [Gordonia phage Fireball]